MLCTCTYLPNPSSGSKWYKVNFQGSKDSLNLEFSFFEAGWITKAKGFSLPYSFLIDGGEQMYSWTRSETQTALSKIWIQVTDSTPNRFSKSTFVYSYYFQIPALTLSAWAVEYNNCISVEE